MFGRLLRPRAWKWNRPILAYQALFMKAA